MPSNPTMPDRTMLVLPGDGIGPEVMRETLTLLDWLDKRRKVTFTVKHGLVGGASLDKHNIAITDETMADAMAADCVLFGAVGGPKWDGNSFDKKPERGLLRLRKDMDLFANLRPALVFDALADASSLKREVVQGLDVLIVRELTGGVYFGEPRGIFPMPGGGRRGVNTQVYTTAEIDRVARVAFDLARKRKKKVHSVEKNNVMESGLLWKEEVSALHARDYKDVELHHMLADNCAMQLVRWPHQFDVIVTDNLFGDILSDIAAMLTGSLGMLPSASLGALDPKTHKRHALYEPVHGSAPDIAGKGLANPIAQILSFAMALRYSFDLPEDAELIEKAVAAALDRGLRTADIAAKGEKTVSTTEMTAAIRVEMDRLAA